MNRVGILVAMESEIKGLIDNLEIIKVDEIAGKKFYHVKSSGLYIVIALSGIGKVNASMAATILIERYSPDIIVSSGIAGGLESFAPGTVVIASKLVQHDLDTQAFGDPKGLIIGPNLVELESDKRLVDIFAREIKNSVKTTLASGDQFVSSKEKTDEIKSCFGAGACDMESCAIAQVAYLFNIPFIAIRKISDTAGDDAISEYEFNFADEGLKMAKILIHSLPALAQMLGSK